MGLDFRQRLGLRRQLHAGVRQHKLPANALTLYDANGPFAAQLEARVSDTATRAMASSGGRLGSILQWIEQNLPAIIQIVMTLIAAFGGESGPAPTPTAAPVVPCRPYIKFPDPGQLRPRNAIAWRVADLCKAYDFPKSDAPGGGLIGIVELGGGWSQADLDSFCQSNGLPKIVVEDMSVDGTTNRYGTDPDADGEVALDIEVAAAAYYYATGHMPRIKILWASDMAPAVRAATAAGCDVCSISWGADEVRWAQNPGSAEDMETAAAEATAAGCIVFAASGDNSSGDGDRGANVDLPAGCPHVIGCGGTTKTTTLEIVWGRYRRNNGAGTGGGFSSLFPLEPWQLGAPQGRGRMVPDVAANADPNTGYLIVVHGQETQIGGTSAVAPLFAGLFAALGTKLGFVTPTLYESPRDFGDIAQGSNGAFFAQIGPDPCTGLGVPIGANLAATFSAHHTPGVEVPCGEVALVPSFTLPPWAVNAAEQIAAELAAQVMPLIDAKVNAWVQEHLPNPPIPLPLGEVR